MLNNPRGGDDGIVLGMPFGCRFHTLKDLVFEVRNSFAFSLVLYLEWSNRIPFLFHLLFNVQLGDLLAFSLRFRHAVEY